jgi:hypothetical protein
VNIELVEPAQGDVNEVRSDRLSGWEPVSESVSVLFAGAERLGQRDDVPEEALVRMLTTLEPPAIQQLDLQVMLWTLIAWVPWNRHMGVQFVQPVYRRNDHALVDRLDRLDLKAQQPPTKGNVPAIVDRLLVDIEIDGNNATSRPCSQGTSASGIGVWPRLGPIVPAVGEQVRDTALVELGKPVQDLQRRLIPTLGRPQLPIRDVFGCLRLVWPPLIPSVSYFPLTPSMCKAPG